MNFLGLTPSEGQVSSEKVLESSGSSDRLDSDTVIREGDLVFLFLSVKSVHPLYVQPKIKSRHGITVENKFQCIYGVLNVMDLVGRKFGTRVELPLGWAYVLKPTCDLWSRTVRHRTQIIYTPDQSLIIAGLRLAPGSVVIEAGTGSGALSHSLIRAVYPTGHLFTFDFHEKRAEMAREEFEKHGLSKWVTSSHRDVVADGFGLPRAVDAVFLDLPNPWEVVPHVVRSLKRGGRLCTFSPCIEQVQKTCKAMKKTKSFHFLKTKELVNLELSVRYKTSMSLDFEQVRPTSGPPPPTKKDVIKFRTVTRPDKSVGHTGYLTFATFLPSRNQETNSPSTETVMDIDAQ